MTIRRRFTISFSGIMAMFALNAGGYVWSNQRRSVAMEELRRAITRQVLLTSVQLTFIDAQKQIGFMSQIGTEAGVAGASEGERGRGAGRRGAAGGGGRGGRRRRK